MRLSFSQSSSIWFDYPEIEPLPTMTLPDEAAVNLARLVQQWSQPVRVEAGVGGGEASVSGMEGKATDGVDGRFTEDERWPRFQRDGEAAPVFAGAGGQAVPALPLSLGDIGFLLSLHPRRGLRARP
jgi:hypothetical protein